MSALRWEEQQDGKTLYAYSGDLVVGMVGRRSADPSRVWYSATSAVFMNHIAKGNGEVSSVRTAVTAVERAWSRWLALSGLQPSQPYQKGQKR
jgi:3-deoxy-D-arabino-heptulosonate 7-phosphate (DAHP) synthase class II